MRIQSRSNTRKSQQGISLIELMITMVLGLLVVSALFNVFAGTKRSTAFTDGLRTMQENGRFGIATLQEGFRLAGYSPGASLVPFDIAAGSENSVVVRQMAKYDCNGQLTTGDGIAENTYTFDPDEKRITCRGNSLAATDMPLIEGVDGFRVLYGMANESDRPPTRYVGYSSTLDPSLVASVRVAILVNSVQPIRTRRVKETYVLLDDEIEKDDQFARGVFTTTVMLRNGG